MTRSFSVMGLMATSSKRVYTIPRSNAPRAPCLVAVHCWPIPPRGHSNRVLSQSLWGLWVLVCTTFVWALWVSLADMGFDSQCDFAPPTVLLGLLLCPLIWGISSQLLQCCAAIRVISILLSPYISPLPQLLPSISIGLFSTRLFLHCCPKN